MRTIGQAETALGAIVHRVKTRTAFGTPTEKRREEERY